MSVSFYSIQSPVTPVTKAGFTQFGTPHKKGMVGANTKPHRGLSVVQIPPKVGRLVLIKHSFRGVYL